MLPDVPAIDKSFDYLVPDGLADRVRVGTIVRVELHGRRVGGWVVAVDVEPPPGVALRPIAKVTGWGPSPELIDLADWAAWRWAGRPASLLGTASPPNAVTGLPRVPARTVPVPAVNDELVADALGRAVSVVRRPPAEDPWPFVLAAAGLGNALIVTPSLAAARSLGARLRRAGVTAALVPRDWAQAAAGATVIGARAAAWAPVRDLAAVVVVDEHDEGHQEERTPSWHARDVAVERARRAGVPCVLLSPCPSLEALAAGPLLAPSRADERAGWPVLDVADRRQEDPVSAGLYSDALVRLLRGGGRVVCVLNRTGRSRLLACARCGELARCDRCQAAVAQLDPGVLRCGRCGAERPPLCLACGATRLKNVRAGVTRAREELSALAGEEVAEVTASTAGADLPEARVYVGTEAVLHQVRSADAVAFLDFDQELLAPRYRAAEQALALIARAARLVGGRRGGGRVLVQTRIPEHEVVQAALHADPSRVAAAERERRELLRFPPYAALAAVSGPAAGAFVDAFGHPLGVEVLGPTDGRWLLRAPDHRTLCDALAATKRPGGRVRVEVDPLRI